MTLKTGVRTLLTIITESAIEDPLLRDFDKLGVRGYTVCDARGRGSRGARDAAWSASGNIRIDIICSRDLAETTLQHVQARYYDNYAMVAYLHDVEVLRPEKF